MVSILRLSYQRILHQISVLLPVKQLKSVFFGSIVVILLFQLFLLNKSHGIVKINTGGNNNQPSNEILIIDKSTPVSSHYKHLLNKYSENFPTLPFNKKCDLYFDELYKQNEDWEVVDVSKDHNKEYNKEAFNYDKFIKDKIDEYKKKNEGKEPTDGKKAEFELEFQKVLETTNEAEQGMIDAVTHLRVFGKCYLNDQSYSNSIFSNWLNDKDAQKQDDEKIDMCYDIEQRLFPWLSRELPVFKRWTGDTIIGIPKMSKYVDETYDDVDIPWSSKNGESEDSVDLNSKETNKDPQVTKVDRFSSRFGKRYERKDCFLNKWRSMLNGKGIVLSAADKYEGDLIGLIRILRALNNKIPVQIVHKGDLSEKVQNNLIKVARSDEVKVPKYLFDKVKDHSPQNFPKQEIWFVNAKRCIRPEYRGNFNMYANKLIAYLFNSFDDILLMDTDSIPLIKPIEFFKSGPYQRTQTIFFKDRYNMEKVSKHDSEYFKRLMPGKIDESLYTVPRATNNTFENRYIKNQFRHVMEAGVVGIKRSTHFIGILTSIQLNFWTATNSRIWGDKELFWLGQSISGNENYEFNKYDVVAVGELTPMEERPRNTIAHELCSTHPGHLSGDDDYTLMWINSGMRFCKVDTWNGDVQDERMKKKAKDAKELESFYKNPVKINAALIPPGGDRSKPNNNQEPAFGWIMTPPCKGYYWCAYDILGGSTDPRDRGAYVEYDNVTEFRNEYLGKLWLNQDLVDLSKYDKEILKDQENLKLKQKEEEEKKQKEKQQKEQIEKEEKLKAEKIAKEEAEAKKQAEAEAEAEAKKQEEAAPQPQVEPNPNPNPDSIPIPEAADKI
ncbi:Alpha-1,3-mannosyltransferase MNT2 [Wickerhamomyces ciferrii]|uniref:Alpha-1,3-mannosyltransferase MNT2 n=1 Tax=Wickerhamomyces ciferrii (strain ATCC 14091 / BCRC 22168 / CBS 111 / JCM 3599 / NBRC 0793 / NRRL Y-1031 F-60-10) TaxID=1206466 RepID=K0KXJ2_WICCF|nr:Alpha-1,3-mannosyltransferase MNT2 [Wickerhamomyces ciferrii]CCH46204.1 Alpha-1,3-mannosyltransferase MNT2 [Wickerhamomyces ciferrii]